LELVDLKKKDNVKKELKKKTKRKSKWDVLNLIEIFVDAGEILWWVFRGLFHLLFKLFD
jgi:hypothetical protein